MEDRRGLFQNLLVLHVHQPGLLCGKGGHSKRKASDDLEHEAQRRKVAGDDEEKEEESRSTTLWG